MISGTERSNDDLQAQRARAIASIVGLLVFMSFFVTVGLLKLNWFVTVAMFVTSSAVFCWVLSSYVLLRGHILSKKPKRDIVLSGITAGCSFPLFLAGGAYPLGDQGVLIFIVACFLFSVVSTVFVLAWRSLAAETE